MDVPENRSAGALLRDAYGLLEKHWILAIPLVIMGLVTGGGRAQGNAYKPPATLSPHDLLVLLPFFALLGFVALVVIVVLFLLYVVVWLITTHGALAVARGEAPPAWGDSWNAVRGNLGGAFSAAILAALAVLVGLVLLIVPGVIVLCGLFPLFVVLLAEGKGGTDALKRAWELTRGERVPIFLVLLAGIGVNIVAAIVVGWIPIVGGPLAGIVSGFVNAGYAVAAALWYARKAQTSAAPAAPMMPAY